MNLFVKNMVNFRCKMIVKSLLESLGLAYYPIDSGMVKLKEHISVEQLDRLKGALRPYGLELMADHRAILIDRIKDLIIEMVYSEDELPKTKNSVYISEQLNYDYTYLANIFSAATGVTIEHFMITRKIERAKELLIYDGLNLKEISWKLHYSSEAHLSYQFKQVTGLTPTIFKKLKDKRLPSPYDSGKALPLARQVMLHFHNRGLSFQEAVTDLKIKQNALTFSLQTATG